MEFYAQMKILRKLYVAILRYPDGKWYTYSPDLRVKYGITEDLTGDRETLAKIYESHIDEVVLLQRPLDMLRAISMTKRMLLGEGENYNQVFISINDVNVKFNN